MRKKDIIKSSVTLYGLIDLTPPQWLAWYEYGKGLVSRLGYEPNFLGITSESFRSGKVLTVKRTENRIIQALKNGEVPTSLDFLSLPDDYKQAAFDYNVSVCINSIVSSHITVTYPQGTLDTKREEELVQELKQFIAFQSGQIYNMASDESPYFYACKVNPSSHYRSLHIIKLQSVEVSSAKH